MISELAENNKNLQEIIELSREEHGMYTYIQMTERGELGSYEKMLEKMVIYLATTKKIALKAALAMVQCQMQSSVIIPTDKLVYISEIPK